MATADHPRSGDVVSPITRLTPRAPGAIPPLENGDRLTRAEFERRYEAMSSVKKAELIEGVVCMPSPVRIEVHGEQTRHVSGWLYVYEAHTPGVRGGDNSTVWLDLDNEPQPDHLLYLPSALGGQSRVNAQGYLEGSPELIVEVAASSASYDLHDKLKAYRRNQVREYVVWRTEENALDWFVWREGEYRLLPPDAEGLLKSGPFPGLWLDPAALLRRDSLGVLAALQRGLASPEHAAFVERLQDLARKNVS